MKISDLTDTGLFTMLILNKCDRDLLTCWVSSSSSTEIKTLKYNQIQSGTKLIFTTIIDNEILISGNIYFKLKIRKKNLW